MKTLRKDETQKRYDEDRKTNASKGCPLCIKQPIKSFKYWNIVDNEFPYDRVADPHHMIIAKRHAVEDKITEEEWDEYKKLKTTYINDKYEFIFESTPRTITAPGHFHLHLMVTKQDAED